MLSRLTGIQKNGLKMVKLKKDMTMKEIALFGIKYYSDGTQETKLIRRRKSTGEYAQAVELCSDLPVNDYDAFIFADDNGKFQVYDLNKPLRKRKRKRKITYKELFEEMRLLGENNVCCAY